MATPHSRPLCAHDGGVRASSIHRILPEVSARHDSQAPFGLDEVLFSGLFPAIHDRNPDPAIWLDSYLRTYIERDLRSLANIGDLESFTRFLALCAGRTGQLLNSSSLASDAGVTHPTVRRWLSILEASYVVTLLGPHFENYSKRLVKSPKLHFVDTGLICRLLGVRGPEDRRTHPLRGAIFENLIVFEFRKLYLHDMKHPPLHFLARRKRPESRHSRRSRHAAHSHRDQGGAHGERRILQGPRQVHEALERPSRHRGLWWRRVRPTTQPPDSSLVELHVACAINLPLSPRCRRREIRHERPRIGLSEFFIRRTDSTPWRGR